MLSIFISLSIKTYLASQFDSGLDFSKFHKKNMKNFLDLELRNCRKVQKIENKS